MDVLLLGGKLIYVSGYSAVGDHCMDGKGLLGLVNICGSWFFVYFLF